MKKIKALATLFGMALTLSVSAQTTQFIVHHAPGGPADTVARLTVKHTPNNNYIVVNRPGGRGIPAISHIKNSNSILIASVSQIFVTNPLTFGPQLSYDPDNDLEIIAVLGVMPNVLVCNNNNFKNFKSVTDSTKSLNFAAGSHAGAEHLATLLLLSKWKNNHKIILYPQAGNTSLNDLLGGHVDCMFALYSLVKSMIDQKVLTPIFSSHELNLSVPTWKNIFREDFPLSSELSIVVDRKMDLSSKARIKNDLEQAVSSLEYVNSLRQNGIFPVASTSAVAIKNSYNTQQQLKKFIVQNNINLQGR
jgi:tripartite-type tricarboxylate transporter receptor subunit TctC